MTRENFKQKFNLLKIPITIMLLILLVNNFGRGSIITTRYEKNQEILKKDIIIKLTPINVYKKIIEYEIEHPKIVFSQVMIETGHLKSQGARIDNNLFGFTKKSGHIKFCSWEESVVYYKEWQDRKYNGGNYYVFLEKVGYATDSLYISKLIKMEHILFNKLKYGMD